MDIDERFKHYLKHAEVAADASTCLRGKYGAVIVIYDRLNDDYTGSIASIGYNGAPRGAKHCEELYGGVCPREKLGIESGQRYELCRSVHAEQNAIINAARLGVKIVGGDMFLYGKNASDGSIRNAEPCLMCKRLIINAGIKRVIARVADDDAYYWMQLVKSWENEDFNISYTPRTIY